MKNQTSVATFPDAASIEMTVRTKDGKTARFEFNGAGHQLALDVQVGREEPTLLDVDGRGIWVAGTNATATITARQGEGPEPLFTLQTDEPLTPEGMRDRAAGLLRQANVAEGYADE